MCQLIVLTFLICTKESMGYITTIWIKTPDIGSVGSTHADIISRSAVLQDYDIDVSVQHYLNLMIKANQDAAVFLLPTKTMTAEDEFYYAQFGAWANLKNVIEYKENQNAPWQSLAESASIGNILTQSEFKSFFVSWDNGTLRIGAGTVQNPEFHASADLQSFVVKDASVCTVWRSVGYWIVEIEARFEGFYSACGKENTRGNMTLLFSMVTTTRFHCAFQCSTSKTCLGFNYNEDEKLCQIISSDQLKEEMPDQGWIFYRKCLSGNDKCQCH